MGEYMVPLRVFKLYNEVNLPQLATIGSACFDIECFIHEDWVMYDPWNVKRSYQFHTNLNKQIVVPSGWRAMIPTGIIFEIPKGYSVRVHPRSGLAIKNGITFANCEGVIDSDFMHECKILIHNTSNEAFIVNHGDRIAQGELIENLDFQVWETSTRPVTNSNRTGGYGSTGV